MKGPETVERADEGLDRMDRLFGDGWADEPAGKPSTATARRVPYFWVTWLASILAGNASCEFALWFKAHYSDYAKMPNDFNFGQWSERHTLLLNELQAEYGDGCRVWREGQNAFKYTSAATKTTVAGKMDLVIDTDETVLIVDAKTGKPKEADATQVKLYMLLLPRVRPEFKDRRIEGIVGYTKREDRIWIPPAAITDGFAQSVWALIKRASSDFPLAKTPSPQECGFCEITRADCRERVDAPVVEVETDEF